MIHTHLRRGLGIGSLAEGFAVQLNDTHPALAVAELMRLLVDDHRLAWEEAWEITGRALSFTNHTLLPEALEKWKVEMFGAVLPRHLEIVYEINRRFLDEVRHRYPGDGDRVARLSLIDETGGSHGMRDLGLLLSTIGRPQTSFEGQDLYPDLFSKAAALLDSLIRNHPFIDGNNEEHRIVKTSLKPNCIPSSQRNQKKLRVLLSHVHAVVRFLR